MLCQDMTKITDFIRKCCLDGITSRFKGQLFRNTLWIAQKLRTRFMKLDQVCVLQQTQCNGRHTYISYQKKRSVVLPQSICLEITAR